MELIFWCSTVEPCVKILKVFSALVCLCTIKAMHTLQELYTAAANTHTPAQAIYNRRDDALPVAVQCVVLS